MSWKDLTEEQKNKFKSYCDSKYGDTIMFCETGEPMYLDEQNNMIDTKLVIDLLFNKILN